MLPKQEGGSEAEESLKDMTLVQLILERDRLTEESENKTGDDLETLTERLVLVEEELKSKPEGQ